MTALTSGPPHDARALDRWTRVVDAVGARVVADGRAEMPCPTHGGEKPRGLAISVGTESDYPAVFCRTEHCEYADIRAALVAKGAPGDALQPATGEGGRRASVVRLRPRAGTASAGPDAVVATDAQVEAWSNALWSSKAARQALKDAWQVSDETLAQADVGWNGRERRYTFPVTDEDGRAVNVLRRSLTAQPKTKTGHDTSGSYVYAPFPLDLSEPVLLCAGEHDALSAYEAGLTNVVAFTNGEKAVPPAHRLERLRGASVVIAYDNDEAGRTGSARVAAALSTVAGSVSIANLSTLGLNDKGDLTDALRSHGVQAVDQVLADAEPWDGGGDYAPHDDEYERALAAVRAEFLVDLESSRDHLDDLLDDEGIAALPPVEYIVDDWVPRGGYSVLYGEPGVGKTFALMGMARAVRRGTRWQDNATRQGCVVFYQGEGLAQFQDRIAAWEARYPLRADQRMAAWGTTDRVVDLTTPEGVAAVICTVQGFGRRHDEPVALVVIDPLVEFMTGEENGDGMERVSRGLRALAKVLDVGVVVGHHTNASGERERGTAHLRMRAGAFVRMEKVDEAGTAIGVMQQKQRNGEKQALVLEMRSSERSVVLEWTEAMVAQDYIAKKEGAKRRAKDDGAASKRREAEALLLAAVTDCPGISKTPLLKACLGEGVGKPALEETLAGLILIGRLRVEKGARDAQKHYLPDV